MPLAISPYIKALRERIGADLLIIPCVAAVLRDESGNILLVRHPESREWDLPGGSMEPGESPADAVVREAAEETGFVVEPVRIAGVFGGTPEFLITYPHGDQCEATTIVFECPRVDDRQLPPDGEVAEQRFFEPEEAAAACRRFPAAVFLSSAPAVYHWDAAWLANLEGECAAAKTAARAEE